MQQGSDEFDAFYKAARGRLLAQTYALTGDLPAARSAVRDAFVAAWHHWRKVSRLDDPETWVRPHAFQHAQRRHTTRIWHRDKSLDADSRATLDALSKLTLTQRKVLLLTQLSSSSMQEMAREVAVCSSRSAAEAVRPRGTAVTGTPCTVTPEPCAINQPSAPVRSPSRGSPCTPLSVTNQPITPAARQTASIPPAAAAPESVARSAKGRRSVAGFPARVGVRVAVMTRPS